MEMDEINVDHNQDEEYILLDLDAVCGQVDIPPGEPYTLTGLETPYPVLTIGDKLKLIGEYEEKVGTCVIFSENEKAASVDEETGTSETSPFNGASKVDPNQGPPKQIKPVTSLHRIIKFRLLSEHDERDLIENPPDSPLPPENLHDENN